MKQTKLGRSIFAILMTVILVLQMMSPVTVFAATADLETTTKYKDSLGDEASTEYAGRVWTDKSVFAESVIFDTYNGGTETVQLEANKDEEFLIAYSALATAQSVTGQSQAPVDVVLILDISGSMSNGDSNMDNNKSRIYNTVQAANNAIDELMEKNTNNRVAVAVFSNNAQVLLPLDRYSKTTTTERQWVSNPGGWGGSWQNVTVDVPYFTLNRESASNQYAEMTAKAVRASNNQSINVTVDVEGGTNIQMGLYEGMKVLADVPKADTTVKVNGTTVQRVPAVILLSDGSPTYSSNARSWWAPADNYNDGPGSAAYAGNGMKAILVGSYMKDAIDRAYGVVDSDFATKVYTVGMGITGLPDNEKNLAYMTLDTGTYWNNNSDNTLKTTIKNYWQQYTARGNTGTLNINVGQYSGWNYADKNYNLTHPNTGYDVDPVDGYDYVDGYYSADNAAAVTSVFQEIVANISIATPQVPTEIKGDDPLTDGYITYVDPIGRYMEVKDVKAIIYAGTKFEQKAVSTSGDTTTYSFNGEVHSPVYGDQNIDDMLISVTKDSSGNETLTVKIPASVIPLRLNTVELNKDGSVKSHINNGAFPTRVIYSVGLQAGIKKVADDGDVYVDPTALDSAYVLDHVNPDGSINFYSNVFTNTNEVNGVSAGDAYVEFEPAHNNPFYYIQEDMPIYADAEFRIRVTEALDDSTVYYYKDVYYHGTVEEERAIARTGAQLKKTSIVTGSDGYLYRAAGSPRVNRILEFEGTKIQNATGTAKDFYAPIFVHADGNPDPYEGKFVIYHGNNGVVDLMAGGNLEITKHVSSAAGLTAPDKVFRFTLAFSGTNGTEYTYVIRDAAQNQISTGTVSNTNPTIQLADGQTATVYSLPPMTQYTVTEDAVSGFATESTGASGTIHAGKTQQAIFTNNYSVASVTTGPLTGTKKLTGRAWAAGDSFTFFLQPYNDCPLPAGYDANAGITVTAPDVAGGDTASFNFGTLEFTAPGIYRYTVVEMEPENNQYLPGMTYSRALYRAYYEVVDNGDGALVIDAAKSGIQKLYDDEANQLFTYDSNDQIIMNPGQEAQDEITFTNTYSAGAVVRVPTALKAYTDPSGTKPLVSGMFNFRLKAIGYKVDDGEWVADTNIPMPEGAVGGVATTTNEGHNVTFPGVTFTQDLLTSKSASKITYRYEMSEIAGSVPGMSYDNTTHTIDVEVEIDPGQHVLKVNATYPNAQRSITFENGFKLEPVSGDIDGTKVLNGRDMVGGEEFVFSLVGADAATNMAVRDGIITVPKSEAAVSGGKDGQEVAFGFEDIVFTRPGSYTFVVWETEGTAPAVVYDTGKISVTFEIADTNGDAQLEIASKTYSNGENAAKFVNTYTSTYNDVPVSLKGTKNLTGKTMVEGEFYFRVQVSHNGTQINEYMVSHAADDTADSMEVYSGEIVLLSNATYDQAGTYVYTITEQIPDDSAKVVGTRYDETQYRYVVEIADDNQGNLVVASKSLQVKTDAGWVAASNVVFDNAYVPNPATDAVPLIKKVLSGDRKDALKENEFFFKLRVVSATYSDGIILPATEVGNQANGNVLFGDITFTKSGYYTVAIQEIIPDEEDKVPGVTYSTQEFLATFRVDDDRNGQLSAVLTQFEGGDTIYNQYVKQPTSASISGKKDLVGGGLQAGDFQFKLYEADDSSYDISGKLPLQTVSNAADGSFTFDKSNAPALEYTEEGTHYYVLMEDLSNQIAGIRYDTSIYHFQVEVGDDGKGSLVATVDCVNGDENAIVFRNVPHESIVHKTVALQSAPAVFIDGQAVNTGDVLCYTVRYINTTGGAADVTITDAIPAHTAFVSAEDGGSYADGKVTWSLTNVPNGETVEVHFQVKVTGSGVIIENSAQVVEGTNTFTTNAVRNPVDKILKDVVMANEPEISIDGEKVRSGDVLCYKITYTNAANDAAVAVITDKLPAYTEFVAAGEGGVYANGEVKWTLNLAAGETKTVTFDVKVVETGVLVTNQAQGLVGNNLLESNTVTNPVDNIVKDVAQTSAPDISIDGKKVKEGEILRYKITYTNAAEEAATVVITDTLPAYTELVAAYDGGAYANGEVKWTLNLAAGETKTVTFDVKVVETGILVTNRATGFDGLNYIHTNIVKNPVDDIKKDVALASAPAISIDGKKVKEGEVLRYKITYTNAAEEAATVEITDKLPAHTEFVAAEGGVYANGEVKWTLNLAAGETKTVTFDVKVVETGIFVTNQAIGFDGINMIETNIVKNPVDEITKDVALVSAPDISINGKKVKEGEILRYQITYTNTAAEAATVEITDKLPAHTELVAAEGGAYANGEVKWTLNLDAGETKTVTLDVKVVESGILVTNQATAFDGINTVETNIVKNPVDEVVKDVALASAPAISIDGKKVNVGEILRYQITYTNANDGDAVVEITDILPAYTEFVAAYDGGVFANDEVKWTLNMSAGETRTVTFDVKAIAPEVFIDNQATAWEGSNELKTNVVSNHTFEEVGGKDVALASKPKISIDGKLVQVGQILEYTITYTNTEATAVNVTIEDIIPAHTKLHDAKAAQVNGNTLSWEFKNLQPRQSVTVSFQVEVMDPGAVIENQAKIFDGTNKLTNKVINSTPEKIVDKETASVGETLTYQIRYTNTTGKAAKVVITDKLSEALSYVEGTAGDGVYADGILTWTLESVPAGETVAVSFQARIKASTNVTEISNRAEIIENEVDVVATNEEITQVQKPALTISKTQSAGGKATTEKLDVKAGTTVTYELTVTNTGAGKALGITVSDKLPAGLKYVEGSANAFGKLEGDTVLWTLDSLDAGQSVVLSFKVTVPHVDKNTTWKNIGQVVYDNDPTGSDPVVSNEVVIELKIPVTPQTGDNFTPALLISVMSVSAIFLAVLVIYKKKEAIVE